jgi:hypothetical protein
MASWTAARDQLELRLAAAEQGKAPGAFPLDQRLQRLAH